MGVNCCSTGLNLCGLTLLRLITSHNFAKMESIDISSMERYISPINPAIYPQLTLVLLAIGLFFTAWFFVYEVTSTKYTRDMYKELLMGICGSVFNGFGILFLLLWVGIYV